VGGEDAGGIRGANDLVHINYMVTLLDDGNWAYFHVCRQIYVKTKEFYAMVVVRLAQFQQVAIYLQHQRVIWLPP